MGVKFFGQFLLDNGEVEATQLREVADLMHEVNRRLGELAVSKGYVTQVDVNRIHRAQLASDVLFGQLAVELGLLTSDQVAELIAEQTSSQLRIGDALVELGYLDQNRLKLCLERFEAEQAVYQAEGCPLPDEFRGSPVVEFLVDQVPKIALRTSLCRLKLGEHRDWAGSEPLEYGASISIRGDDAIDVGITADAGLMAEFTSAGAESSSEGADAELYTNMLAAFLTVVARNAQSSLEKRWITLQFKSPQRDALPPSGVALELVSLRGQGWLILMKP